MTREEAYWAGLGPEDMHEDKPSAPADLRAEAEKVAQALNGHSGEYMCCCDRCAATVAALLAFAIVSAQRHGARERLDTIDTAIMLAENVPLSNPIDPGSIRLDILRVLRGMEAALRDKETG